MKLTIFNGPGAAPNILMAGTRGVFDVFGGSPLYFWLKQMETSMLKDIAGGGRAFFPILQSIAGRWTAQAGRQCCPDRQSRDQLTDSLTQ